MAMRFQSLLKASQTILTCTSKVRWAHTHIHTRCFIRNEQRTKTYPCKDTVRHTLSPLTLYCIIKDKPYSVPQIFHVALPFSSACFRENGDTNRCTDILYIYIHKLLMSGCTTQADLLPLCSPSLSLSQMAHSHTPPPYFVATVLSKASVKKLLSLAKVAIAYCCALT